ncbi:MAG: SusC/RagA family TonB-linked outer membrane protein, partial [Tidjanibacter sp.]|nr:SusC/RagA family TonB-linked outer membrane protein [Tidjanibacter sp.]
MKNTTFGKILLMALVALMAGMTSVSAQSHKVTGTVTADDGSAIIGANVLVVGQTMGTTTDVKGNYSITVSDKASLEFSYLGYETQVVAVGKRSKIDVTLASDSQVLEDLVVVGYGVQRRSDVAGSVASIKAEDMNIYPSSNISEMLRGLSAGVQVTSGGGAPGSSSSIQIRGSRSLTASNSPLYVIDGVPSNATEFNMINNNDVASIEILKDAAAQAIYGARAANGVVMVTTKRGQSGKTEVNFESTISVQSLWRNFKYYDPESWVELRRQAVASDMGIDDPEAIAALGADYVFQDPIMQKNWEEAIWTDWESLMIKPAVMQKYSLGIRGGNKKLRFASNFGYTNQDGMIDGSGYQRGNLRVNADYEAYKWLSIGVNTSANKTLRDAAYGSFNQFMTRPPYGIAYDAEGNITKYTNSAGEVNPMYNMQHTKDQTAQD